MPILQGRPAMLGSRQNTSARNSTDSNEILKEHIVILGDEYEKPHKEMDFPSAKLGPLSIGKSRSNLRIRTYSKSELHDRYLSSEEELSPSPDGHGSHDEELRHKPSVRFNDQPSDAMAMAEGKAEIAIAVPILSLGRPKLVDITNLAPIHKRKQRIPKSQIVQATSKTQIARIPAAVDENAPFPANEAAEVVASSTNPRPAQVATRNDSQVILTAPDSWLPSDDIVASDDERYMPELDIRRTPSYHDYDPYSLEPPRLVASTRSSRARGSSGSLGQQTNTSGWKGLTRSLSLAKKHSSRQQAKKPKMIARGANEREDMLIIPPFPFESSTGS